MVVSAVPWASSSSTHPGCSRSCSSTRNRKEESPTAISSPCFNSWFCTASPLTRVPLRLPRSRTQNLPSCPRRIQCFRETEGSTTGMPLVDSRPRVTSPSPTAIIESFNGPESAKSLGCKQSTSCSSLSHFQKEYIPQVKLLRYPNG